MAKDESPDAQHSALPDTVQLKVSGCGDAVAIDRDRHSPTKMPERNRRGNMPSELTSFVGRRAELADVRKMMSSSRLVTLIGIGGVGKTRLALRLAEKAKRSFSDGVWLVELGEVHDPSLVNDVVAATLEVGDHPGRSPQEALTEFLVTRDLLLVLDGCEGVIDSTAELVESLLLACPRLTILATSREPLNIGGEAVLPVPPLTVPDPDHQPALQALPRFDAVTLFADRAAAAVPSFELTEENRVAVARICNRLDGLPLSIELAAARLRAMSPQEILGRLTDRYALLTRGSRVAPARQQTLRLCVDWSYELCTPIEQRVWARLSVFAGGFEIDAAEHVCADPNSSFDLVDVVTSLVDKSILVRVPSRSTRYRMLETLRDYGRTKLGQSGVLSSVRDSHRNWCQHLVLTAEEEWVSSRQPDWLALLGREIPNVREALEFSLETGREAEAGLQIAAAMYWFWMSRGLLGEGRRWLERLLAAAPERATLARVKALDAASILAGFQRDLSAARAMVEKAHTLAEQVDDSSVQTVINHADGLVALFLGDLRHACLCLERASGSTAVRNDPRQVGALHMLGVTYTRLGRTACAIECYERVIEITESCGESVFRSYSLWALAVAVWRQGDCARALHLLKQSLRLARDVENPRTVAVCLEALAWIHADERDAHRAAVLMGAATELEKSVGSATILLFHLNHHHDQCVRVATHALGEAGFESARLLGVSMSFADVLAYALDESARQPPPATVQTTRTPVSATLTRRENEIARLVNEGLTDKAIATRLVISPRTVSGHVEHILAKLGFTSRAQVAAWVADCR
ncbi:tetratricopeptide repeat protein [Rhodococcus sp. ABRD24]|uniref:ATP-binding protein n=1 Tax=Rhodococcus sp. ABRD24 TaxID=2507582 RepID=UPI00103DF4BC|nr:tetratricopeptide repeat protein [Rhodococcus sp. ABRD24]QBJ95890.1 tetratricopeptide repeat protein [Rhodococcus sp. ABRD24]